ncbi:MAG TPA: NAD(P)H-binding protein [Pseudonocardiaceae bacterium]|jgi:NAD(P)H dehydrogenase (quinone)|nr:NAD(P)H-binding protein [Pseudonocardiaceae bacterium]
MSIVITGATGRFGRLVTADLLAAGVPAADITAAVRDEGKAADLQERGVALLVSDYDRPETWAFSPEDRVLLVSGTEVGRRTAQHAAVIDAAKLAGVAQLAYLSVFDAPHADFALAADHRATEQLILDSGLPYTFLRNDWYTEMYVLDLPGVVERGAVTNAVPPGSRIATAARADYAEAAAVVLRTDGHANRAYELSGDVAWTFDEFAAELSRQTGKAITHQPVSAADMTAILVGAGLPRAGAEVLAEVDGAIGRGRLAGTPGELSRLVGRPTTPFADTIRAALA